jgi:hypothetical protein
MKFSSLLSPETKLAPEDTSVIAPASRKTPAGDHAFRWELWRGTWTRLKDAVKMFITEPFNGCHGQWDESRTFACPGTGLQSCLMFPKYPFAPRISFRRGGFVRYPVVSPAGARIKPRPSPTPDLGQKRLHLASNMGSSFTIEGEFLPKLRLTNGIAESNLERFLQQLL